MQKSPSGTRLPRTSVTNHRAQQPVGVGESGQSLTQALIAVALLALLATAFASLMAGQWRETRALEQKLASADLEKLLQASLADGSVCEYIVNNPSVLTFDSTAVSRSTPQVVSPSSPIYASVAPGPPVVLGPVVAEVGQPASAYSPSTVVQRIELRITGAPTPAPPPGPNAVFTGDWVVMLDPTTLVRPLRPITISTRLTVDTTNPASARITGCQAAVAGSAASIVQIAAAGNYVLNPNGAYYANAVATCPAGYVATGGGAHCSSNAGLVALVFSNPAGRFSYYGTCVNWGPGAAGTSSTGYGIRTIVYCMAL